jgi:hypothetical protein
MSIENLGLKRPTENPKLDAWLLRLTNYDFQPITKSCIDRYGWKQEKAKTTEMETKRFFSFAFLDPGHYHIPEPDVDEYWHRMILHTQWYQKFCSDIFGQYYHHTPEPDQDLVSEDNRRRSLELIQYWYGYRWESLVRTCTQCKGPITGIVAEGLEPSAAAKYKGK